MEETTCDLITSFKSFSFPVRTDSLLDLCNHVLKIYVANLRTWGQASKLEISTVDNVQDYALLFVDP